MDLREAMTAGVFVEFLDSFGNSAGTAVYFDWNGSPLPAVGDRVTCEVAREPGRLASTTLQGYVKRRSFDMQQDDDGAPCVWVRLIVDIGAADQRPERRLRASRICFSAN